MIRQATDMINTSAQRGIELRTEQLPVSALVRCPLFAIRYILPNAQEKVRRFQLKFASGSDYDIVFNRLQQLGLRISPTQPPPGSAGSSTSTGRPGSGGPSCPPSRLAEISNRPYTTQLSASNLIDRPTTSPLQTQHEQASTTRPTSAFSTFTVQKTLQPSTRYSYANPLIPPEYFPRPNSASSSVLDYASNSARGRFSDLATIEEDPITRPTTSESMLPPRRELPFLSSSPKPAGYDYAPSGSRPSSSAMGPPPPPSFQGLGMNEPDFSPLPRPTVVTGITSPTNSRPNSPSHSANLSSTISKPIMNDVENEAQLLSPASSPRRASNSILSGAHPLNTNNAALNGRQSEHLAGQPAPGKPSYQDRMLSEIRDDTAANAGDGLAAYALQSPDGRMATLNDFMMQHLQDASFLTLVEDVDACWGRIALGLE
ncbi:hypothetical protein BDV95DRAFT_333177 [Massariosphaeria phaeospora]|uniref:Uncharacterized protein n=1 Tax=Massariosphaeria phaeospora TaxID=100035 RepID=A0A7C8M9F3_9PLEO|nr:hypothetical protein BDV95DRAFT_333177 [Massariosphaeria phaeospora]